MAIFHPEGSFIHPLLMTKGSFFLSFIAAFLTTCGLKIVGAPCEYVGTESGLHGNNSNTPAENVSYKVIEVDEPYFIIKGDVSDGIIFGDKMMLHRTISCNYKERKLHLHGIVANNGFRRARHMTLYHCNIGYLLLTPSSEVYVHSLHVNPRNGHAVTSVDSWMKMDEPNSQNEEICYFHILRRDEKKLCTCSSIQSGARFWSINRV